MKQFLSHVLSQLRIGFRDPAYLFTSILLPAGLYWFFAVPESKSAFAAKFMTGSFCAFAFFGIIFLQYSINTSQEKESAWSIYLKTLPIPTWVHIFSRLIASFILGSLACLIIYLASLFFTPTDLSLQSFCKMLILLMIGGLPFLLMGLVIGQAFKPRAVVPVSNFFHLTLSFAGGLWKPPEILPKALQPITPWLPTYHYGSLAWSVSSSDFSIKIENWIYLFVFGLVMTLILFIQNQKQTIQE